MCHHDDYRLWDERPAETEPTADEEDREQADEPTFLKEEPATDVDLLTDGGDEE